MERSRQRGHASAIVGALVSALVFGLLVAGCGASEPKTPVLAMPALVGTTVGDAEATTYDQLHTSLIYYDLSPADRTAANDWVVVATSPASGKPTRKFDTVYAWVLKASEYQWFKAHPTMPKIPAGTTAAALLGLGGLLEPVKDLVQLRYAPGTAPKSAKPSPADAKAFAPDRGMHPDLASEPPAEFALREGLLLAPSAGTVAVGVRPATGTTFRTGQYLVVLVKAKPPPKKKAPTGGATLGVPGGSSGGGSGGGSGSGSGGGIKLPGGIKIPRCPKALCG